MPLSQKQIESEYISTKSKSLFDAAMRDKNGYEKKRQALIFHATILNKRLQFFEVEKKPL